MARPSNAEQARRIRQELSLSQGELAKEMHCSQAQISGIERGERSPEATRRYLRVLQRLQSEGPDRAYEPFYEVFGPPLKKGFDHYSDLPGAWTPIGVARASDSVELVLAEEPGDERKALVGYHLIDGDLKRGRMIAIDDDCMPYIVELLRELTGSAQDGSEDEDDGLLDEDE